MGWRTATSFAVSLLVGACGQGGAGAPPGQEIIGLYSSLPIAWGESEDIRGFLADDAAPHWVLEALRAQGRVVPLDTLANAQGVLPLPSNGVVVLAQPRPLTAQENVALDAWVRGGGRVLLFADPMLTAHSLFGPGDPRRPQDMAMLSPILGRWGLELLFDDTQDAGERWENGIPVNLPGRFQVLGKSGAGKSGGAVGKAGDVAANCRIESRDLIADCTSGKGRILALADAALLDNPEKSADLAQRRRILSGLLQRLLK